MVMVMRAQRFPFCVQLHVGASKLPVSLETTAALRMLAVAFLNGCQLEKNQRRTAVGG